MGKGRAESATGKNTEKKKKKRNSPQRESTGGRYF